MEDKVVETSRKRTEVGRSAVFKVRLSKTLQVLDSRTHSTVFREEECEALVELVEQHRSVLMNPMKNAEASHAKDRAWAKVCRLFNARGFSVCRSVDHLRVKWENMKKSTRKKTNNLQDVCFSEHDELTRRVLALLCQASSGGGDHDAVADDNSGEIQQWEVFLNQNEENDPSNQNGDDAKPVKYSRESRSMSFTPHECNMLLQCVKAERKHVFNKYTNSKANRDKNLAWARITEAFNKEIVDHNRTTKVLRTKFENMKKMARAVAFGQTHNLSMKNSQPFDEGVPQILKKEQEETDEMEEMYEASAEQVDLLGGAESDSQNNLPADPLSSVLNGYTHTDSEDIMKEDPEVVRLKIELLNYQLETARMERQRVRDAMEGDAAERAKRDHILSLQLREARLALAASEQRLPPHYVLAPDPTPHHPASHFSLP